MSSSAETVGGRAAAETAAPAPAAAASSSNNNGNNNNNNNNNSFDHDLASFSAEVGVVMVPALEDNYMYILFDKSSKEAAVVDPVEAKKMADVAKKLGLDVRRILTTHSHWDHAGGNKEFAALFPGIEVVGGKGDKAQAATVEVGDGDTLSVGAVQVSVLFTPCHTPGHVCYVAKGAGPGPAVVFTGDTLFVGGCGNFNAGTPAQMRAAFAKLAALPGDTLVCCGHEYTSANLAYARFVEPGNKVLASKAAWVAARRAAGLPTMPSTLAEEAETNPFMRAVNGVPSVAQHCGSEDPTECILFVRKEKSAGKWKTAAM